MPILRTRGLQVGHVGQQQIPVRLIGPHRQPVELHKGRKQPPFPLQVRGADSAHRGRPILDYPAKWGDGDQPGSVRLLSAEVVNAAVLAGYPYHAMLGTDCSAAASFLSVPWGEALVHARTIGDIADDGLGEFADPGVHLLDYLGVEPRVGQGAEREPPQLGFGQPLGDQYTQALPLRHREEQPSRPGPQHVPEILWRAIFSKLGCKNIHRPLGDKPERARIRQAYRAVAPADESFPVGHHQFWELVSWHSANHSPYSAFMSR